ncbi:MAG: hypothetical protein AAFZ87_02805 [Planctomycetota bacterium]
MNTRTNERGPRTGSRAGAARLTLALAGLTASGLVGCTTVRPVEEVLDVAARADAGPTAPGSIGPRAPEAPPGRAELVAYAERQIDAYDASCRGCLAAAEAEDADYDALMTASRALIFNADLRIQLDAVQRIDPAAPGDVEGVIFAEDKASSELRSEIRSLARSSRDFAARALELREGDGPARLFRALGDGLYLWSLGPMQALTSSSIRTLPGRVKRLAKDDPTLEGASPLRLEGRFATRAPWPYRDRDAAIGILERACEAAPLPINLDLVEPLGSEALLHARFGDDNLVFKAETQGDIAHLSGVGAVHVPAHLIKLFDAETGRALNIGG